MLKEFNTEEIYIRHAVDRSPNGRLFDFHIHDRCEIYYFISGCAEYLVEGSVYPMNEGSLLIMRPGEAHRVSILREDRYERYAVNFPLSLFDSFDPRRHIMRPFTERMLGRNNHFVLTDARKYFDDMCADDLDYYSRNVRMMSCIMVLCDREFSRSAADRRAAVTQAEKMVAYVNSHLFDELSVDLLAEHFYLSRSQFTRIFRQATGAPPHDYITAKRLIAAKEMISSGASAGYAAESCGFGDYSSFYRAYVKRFGKSPRR